MGRVGRTKRPADPERAHLKSRLRSFLTSSGGAYRLYRDGAFKEGTVKNWTAGRGSLPNLEQAVKLARHTTLSLDWLATDQGSPTRSAGADVMDEAARESTRAAMEGLSERLPLRSHLVFEYRTLSAVAVKLGSALAERRGGPAPTESYRLAGRLLGECVRAPLDILGISHLPPEDSRIAQAYISAAAHAVEILAHYARPADRQRRKPRRSEPRNRRERK